MALLSCKDAAFAYEGNVVVSELNVQVERGDYLCVVGENGSGKSTLVKGMLGLISPCKGAVEYGDGLRRTQIGYLPQRSDVQRDFPASVWEVVASGFADRSIFLTAAEKRAAMDNMEMLSIGDLRKKSFMELSGGQQQRVLLARALCSTHSMLLLDEPVAGLDPLVTKEMYELIERLHREQNVTIVMISHDIPAALHYAAHILHLSHTPLFYGTAEEYARSTVGRSFAGGETA